MITHSSIRTHVPGRRAFTVVELLVSIAIIATLTGVLLPALSRSRASSHAAVCLTNLRRIGVANQLYVDAHGVFPPVRLQTDPMSGASYVNSYGRDKPRWQWFVDQGIGPVIDPLGFPSPFGDSSVSTSGARGTTMTNRYFLDPALNDERFSFDERNGAYGYNYQFLGNSRTDRAAGQYDHWPVSVGRIVSPSQTVAFADSRGGAEEHGNHSYTLDPPRLAPTATRFGPNGASTGEELGYSPVEMRHLGRGNVVFVDTHAESSGLQALGYELDDHGRAVPNGARGSNSLWSGTSMNEHTGS